MNRLYGLFCRVYQGAFRLALPILPYRKPKLYESVAALEAYIARLAPRAALIVTDRGVRAAGLIAPVEALLSRCGVACVVYDGTRPNPTTQNVEEARALYAAAGCGCIIAVGGGSPMDCAKGVGARIARPRKSLQRMKGLLRVCRGLPPLIAIPTTAGTGSETTLTAVLTDAKAHHKYTMNDFALIPAHAVLDPALTAGLPPHLTATTGMDALTHAVEAFIGRSTTKETRNLALDAVGRIFRHIGRAYHDGSDMEARREMLLASFEAGQAFSKSYVGYVHAVAHSLGGQYGVPHGLANAVLLPHVLERYGKAAHRKLHALAVAAGVARETDAPDAAAAFIAAIRRMNAEMGIPSGFDCIRPEDVPAMARHAAREANPLYPVPVLMDAKELEAIYHLVSEGSLNT